MNNTTSGNSITLNPNSNTTVTTAYLNFPYAHRVKYPYSLETFEISNEISVNIFIVTTIDKDTYVHDTRTLMVFYE